MDDVVVFGLEEIKAPQVGAQQKYQAEPWIILLSALRARATG